MPASGNREILSGWGGTPRSAAWLQPASDDLAGMLAGDLPRGILARGLGRSYGDASLNAGGVVVDMTGARSTFQIDAARGTLLVSAGFDLRAVIDRLRSEEAHLAVVPGTSHVTIGGAIASDIHGKNHPRAGSFGSLVRSMRVLTADGAIRTVSRQHEADLFWATIGGMGLTGIILDAEVSLSAGTATMLRTRTERAENLERLMGAILDAEQQWPYLAAWVDLDADGVSLGRGILTTADHTDVKGSTARRKPHLPAPPRARVLSPMVLRAFNRTWFAKGARDAGRERTVAADTFFFVLDGVEGWNALYGQAGFIQYQFVVPDEGAQVVADVLATLRRERIPAALGVLKRLGHGHGFLSFPIQGWTLSIDVPAAVDDLGIVLRGFDELVAAAGGRVYLTKDALLRPDMVEAMYPQLARWRSIREQADPRGVFRSDLGRRTGLIDP